MPPIGTLVSHHTVKASHPSPLSVHPCHYHNSLDFLLQMPREIPDRASVFITKRFFPIVAALDKSQKLPKKSAKRKNPGPSLPGKKQKLSSFPIIGARPIFNVSFRLPHLSKVIASKALMDTGATTFCLSDRFVRDFAVPTISRENPQGLRDAAGRQLACGSEYTQPVCFMLSN